MFKFKAIGVSEGLAHAKALVIKEADLTVVKDTITDAAAEQQRVLDAVEKAKKQIVLRLSPSLWEEIHRWAEEDFRSINSQIEYLLTESVRRRKSGNKKEE